MKGLARIGFGLWFAAATCSLEACSLAGSGFAGGSNASSSALAPSATSTEAIQPLPSVQTASDSELSHELTQYLQGHRLPLVGANAYTDKSGHRQVTLYGYVATPFGKSDAEAKARALLNDPNISVDNRVEVKPELASMNPPAQQSSTQPQQNEANTNGQGGPQFGSVQNYMNQQDPMEAYRQGNPAYQQQGNPNWMSTLIPMFGMGTGFGMGSFGGGVSSFGSFGGYGSPFGSPYGPPPGYPPGPGIFP